MPQKPDPTPDEIEERCEEVQATWSDQVRRSRSLGFLPLADLAKEPPNVIPQVETPDDWR